MRILFVKLSSIGDIVHTLPTLAAVRKALPDAEISWAVEKSSAEILRENRLINNLIEIDTRSLRGGKIIENILLDASKQLRELRKFDFDIALDFQGLLKSATVAKLSKQNESTVLTKQICANRRAVFCCPKALKRRRIFTSSAKI